MKKINLILILVLVLGSLVGCANDKKMELPKDMTDKEFYQEGQNFGEEAMKNVEIKEYKINLDGGFLGKYSQYKLDDKKQTYYNILKNFAVNYNKFKETDNDEYLDKMISDIKEVGKFLEANTK